MNVTFITDLRDMTYEYYLQQPKTMLEWKWNAILARNPNLVNTLKYSTHSLIRRYQQINEDNE